MGHRGTSVVVKSIPPSLVLKQGVQGAAEIGGGQGEDLENQRGQARSDNKREKILAQKRNSKKGLGRQVRKTGIARRTEGHIGSEEIGSIVFVWGWKYHQHKRDHTG